MNIPCKTTVAALLLAAAAGQAQADGWLGHGRHGFTHYRSAPVRVHGSGWIAPLVVLGIAGAALSAASHAPEPVVVQVPPPVEPVFFYQQSSGHEAQLTYAAAPQVVESAPNGIAYYCPSYGQYHPQVQSCPAGWQLVAMTR